MIALIGCAKEANETPQTSGPAATAAAESGHHHGDAPHGGTLADWGGGAYHVEFTVDHDAKSSTVYILGEDAKTPLAVKAEKLLLTIIDPAFQVELAADPRSGEIFDYFGGLEDIEARRVRFIGDPEARIAEDHLRILRFFRFHARFGVGDPDRAALDACTRRANDLMALSRERIADELLKLLGMPDPSATVRLMLDRQILKPVVPEIGSDAMSQLDGLIGAEREAAIEPDALRRLSALLPPEPSLAEKVAVRLEEHDGEDGVSIR